jgi:hypothetical protein
MLGLGWFGTVLLIIGLIVTCPIWGTILFYAVVLVFKILEGIFTLIEEILAETVEGSQAHPKAAWTVAGAAVLGAIFALAYFFS